MKGSKKVSIEECSELNLGIQNIRNRQGWSSRISQLSVKNMWETWKDNQTIGEYTPDYTENEFPERSFLFKIVGTLYEKELEEIVKSSYSGAQKITPCAKKALPIY